ncbi:hypothetical protein C8F01DRAFT_42824 [Mycena amicta]|nr:hypothetical protein C8F01DRAFT_42824 [Mycena amicta]
MLASLRLSFFFVSAANALIFTIPATSTTPGTFNITYKSEASDPAGLMQFWLGHQGGVGGYFFAAQNVPHVQTATTVAIDIPDSAADGQQWQVAAGPGDTNFPEGLFAFTNLFTINAVSSASSLPTSLSSSASSSSISTSSSAFSSSIISQSSATSSPTPSKTSSLSPSGSPISSLNASSAGITSHRSSPSAGLIAGVTIAAVLFLLIIAFLLFYIRRLRRRSRPDLESRYTLEPEPVFMASSGPASSSLIQPYSSTRSRSQSTAATTTTTTTMIPPLPMGSKAATARQEYLTNQLAAVQAQLQAIQRGSGRAAPVSPGSTPSSTNLSVRNPDNGLREQNTALHARIQMLEGQLQSQWALGLSDEPPPGYME